MFRGRRAALRDPVTVTLDGDEVAAERGEPLAMALLAADKTIIARSPKLHRPRAPSCFRGACDGCLARVDGVPNVMTCLVPARGGEAIESQNVVGSRKADILRVTDWFFPKGIDHHHLMAGVPGLQDVMQSFAQKVAGLGRLPAEVVPPRPAKRIELDALVVGGGPAGITAASRIARSCARTLLVDDQLRIGGALQGAPQHLAELLVAEPLAGVEVRAGHTALGVYEGDVLVGSKDAAMLVRPKALVLATGRHDGTVAVPGNDLPGVFSARALARLLAAGLEPDGPVAIVGDGFWAERVAERAGSAAIRVAEADLVSFEGTAGVKAIVVRANKRTKVAVVGLAAAGGPAFEVAEQAGASTRHGPEGYAVETSDDGSAAPGVFATGECTGQPFDVEAIRARAAQVAAVVLASLR